MPECPRCGESLNRSTVTQHAENPAIRIRTCSVCEKIVEYTALSVREYVYDDSEKPRSLGREPVQRYEPARRYEA